MESKARPYFVKRRAFSYASVREEKKQEGRDILAENLLRQATLRGIQAVRATPKAGTVILELENGRIVVAKYVLDDNIPHLLIPADVSKQLGLKPYEVMGRRIYATNKTMALKTALALQGEDPDKYVDVTHTAHPLREPTEPTAPDPSVVEDLMEKEITIEDTESEEEEKPALILGFEPGSFHPGVGVGEIVEKTIKRDLQMLKEKAKEVLQSIYLADVRLELRGKEQGSSITRYSGIASMWYDDYGILQSPVDLVIGEETGAFVVVPRSVQSSWISVYDVNLREFGMSDVRVSATNEEEAARIAVQFAKRSAPGKVAVAESKLVSTILEHGLVRKVSNADWAPAAWSASWIPRPWAVVDSGDGLFLVRKSSMNNGVPWWKGVIATWQDFEDWYSSFSPERRASMFGSALMNTEDAIRLHGALENDNLTREDKERILYAFTRACGVNDSPAPVVVSVTGWKGTLPSENEAACMKRAGIIMDRKKLLLAAHSLLPQGERWLPIMESEVHPIQMETLSMFDWLYRRQSWQ